MTGSGRQIAGLHAMTDGIINEIIAHATAAVFFDPDVDTIFEIGGQDAKYTYITNGVPSDYAMNEACSAGTGSFLEEAARETLNIGMEEIAAIALAGRQPPNFNDQCAAFISSDIKNAFHEGISREDIVAGLVYSICMNYSNRVKGNRAVGQKVFMQGGVCYNRAVPLAMADPDGQEDHRSSRTRAHRAPSASPWRSKDRLELGLAEAGEFFPLAALMDREMAYGAPFICDGGKEKCDRAARSPASASTARPIPSAGPATAGTICGWPARRNPEDLDLVRRWERLTFDKSDVAMDQAAGSSV